MPSHQPDLSVAESELSVFDLLRVCRDLAWSEIAAMPGNRSRMGPRLPHSQASTWPDWSSGGLALDSLACMQLATAATIWCNAQDTGFEDLFLAKRSVKGWADAMQRARSAGAQGFTFSTSGSTGKRRHIRHAYDSLTAEAHSWAQVLQTAALPVRRIVTMVPCHHIYGFIWGVLVPKAMDVLVIDASHEALPELHAGDLLVGVPDQWHWLAGSLSSGAAPVQGVTSTAPMSGLVHQRLITAKGATPPRLARLLQIYGSTETGGIGWRDDPDASYTLAPGRSRGAGGEIELLLPGGTLVALALEDEVRWTGTSQFELLRRTDNCVQVGGHNVSVTWVREQLLAYPAVEDASVRLDTFAPHPRLKAFIVLKAPANQALQTELQEWALENLPWYAALGSICYGAELPRNAMGKLSDWPVQNATLL